MLEIINKITISCRQQEFLEAYTGHPAKELLLFDIETTGLSRERSQIYLIGCAYVEASQLIICQWMAQGKGEEPDILKSFAALAQNYSYIIHYNGKRFDIPFVEHRLLKHQLPSIFAQKASLDVYLEMNPCKALLKLDHMRQPDLEAFLNTGSSRQHCDGGLCIPLYQKYTRHPTQELAATLLGHNQEDLEGLWAISSLLTYCELLKGHFTFIDAQILEEHFQCRLSLSWPVPRTISYCREECYLTAREHILTLRIALNRRNLKKHYENYKDYYYLPGEDMAVHKSLSSYLDASLRIPATEKNCYTWFPCTEEFLQSPSRILTFIQENLFYWTK